MSYDDVVEALQAGKAGSGLPCSAVQNLLSELGFHVKDGSKGGHKTVTHPHLPDFTSTGYNCKGGHGTVDRHYLGNLIRVIKLNKDAIERYINDNE